jgi:hypothetical protein
LLSKKSPTKINPQRSPRVFRKAGKNVLEVDAVI